MSRIAALGYRNLIDPATLAAGDWRSALPLANLKDRRLARVARSTDATTASTLFTIDLGATPEYVRILALAAHNLSLDARVRFRGYTDAGLTALVEDSGWFDAWPTVFQWGDLPFEAPNFWSGQYTAAQIAEARMPVKYLLGTAKLIRYWKVEIDDTANADGYVQIGRVFIGDAWQPTTNYSYGATLGWETATQVQQALSGAEYFQARPQRRVCRVPWPDLDYGEAMVGPYEIQRQMGLDGEVFLVWDPEDVVNALRRDFLGRLAQLDPIENPYPAHANAAFTIKELL